MRQWDTPPKLLTLSVEPDPLFSGPFYDYDVMLTTWQAPWAHDPGDSYGTMVVRVSGMEIDALIERTVHSTARQVDRYLRSVHTVALEDAIRAQVKAALG